MKSFVREFVKRGLLCAAGGPLILGIVYGILGATSVISALTPREVCTGFLSITLMAFIAAGITAVYQAEQLPIAAAALIHGGVLYVDYLLIYLLNRWIPRNGGIVVFSAVFVAGYAVVWLCVRWCIKRKTDRLNQKLHQTE